MAAWNPKWRVALAGIFAGAFFCLFCLTAAVSAREKPLVAPLAGQAKGAETKTPKQRGRAAKEEPTIRVGLSGGQTSAVISADADYVIRDATTEKGLAKRAKGSALGGLIKNFTLEITGTLGFDYAQVTRGGVDMRDISDDLESKLVKNLYFAGEILDVDGDCGGYNLHFAFTSAKTVAEAISNNEKA